MSEAASHAESLARRQQRLVTAKELGILLRLSERHVYALARAGDIPAKRYGGRWRFDVDQVLAAGDLQGDGSL